MLRSAIRMDLLLSRKALLLNGLILLPMFVLWLWMGEVSLRAFVVLAAFVGAMLPVSIITHEEKARGMVLSCSLPVSRRTIVLARYVLGFSLTSAWVFVVLLLAVVLPFSRVPASDVLRVSTLLFALVMPAIIMAVLLPATLRFGFLGVVLGLVILQLAGIVAMLLARFGVGKAGVRLIIGSIEAAVVALHGYLGQAAPAAVMLAGVSLLMVVSYWLAAWLFQRREL